MSSPQQSQAGQSRSGHPIIRALRWFLSRPRRFIFGLLILLVIAHAIFNFIMGRRLDAELDHIRASGAPLTLAEVAPPRGPDAENAAQLYFQAFDALPQEKDGEIIAGFISLRQQEELPPAVFAQVEKIVAGHEQAFQLLEKVSLQPAVRFPVKWEAASDAVFHHLKGMRAATRFLCAKALVEAHRGRSGEAFETLAVIVRMANHVGTEPAIVSHLVRVAMLEMLFASLPEILASAPPTTAECRAFYDLLGEVDIINSYITAMEAERCNGLWAFKAIQKEGPFGAIREIYQGLPRSTERRLTRAWPVIRPLWAPLLKLDKILYLQLMARSIKLAKKTYAQSQAAYSPAEPEEAAWYAPVSSMAGPVYTRMHEKRDGLLAALRVAQAAIALRSYQIEHGEYPASLEQIASSWEIQEDPFSGKPLVYRREGKGYLIYSLGPDLTDNKGLDFRTAREKAGSESAQHDIPLHMPH